MKFIAHDNVFVVKNDVDDFPFLVSIENHINKLSGKYSNEIEKELDRIYEKVAVFIALNGIGMWERLVDREGIEKALIQAYQEVGYFIHQQYNDRYDGDDLGRGIVNIAVGSFILERLATTDRITGKPVFTSRTIDHIQSVIDSGGSKQEVSDKLRNHNNKKRANSIAITELGIAQSFAEMYTMREIGKTKNTKKYWIGVLDDKIRDSHFNATQNYPASNAIPLDSYFNVNGSLMLHPRDVSAPPEEIVNCRCYVGYIIS